MAEYLNCLYNNFKIFLPEWCTYLGFEPFWTKKSYSILSVRYYAIIWILAKKNSPPDIYDLIPTVDSSSFSKLTSSWCCLLGFISDSWSYSAKCITFVDIVDSELKGEISLLSTNTYVTYGAIKIVLIWKWTHSSLLQQSWTIVDHM